MKLAAFEREVDKVILKRGEDYFYQGLVTKVKQTGNHYKAVVEGSSDYKVEVFMDGSGAVTSLFCNCPYDLGEYCKHEAAVLYYIKDLADQNPPPGKDNLSDILSKLSKDELVSLITSLSEKYDGIEEAIRFQYSSFEDEISVSKKLVRESIQQAKDRGFIAWNRMGEALEGSYLVLEKAEDHVERNNQEHAIKLGLIILPKVVSMLQFSDDSNGEISPIMNGTFHMIEEAVQTGQWTEAEQEKLFGLLMKEATHKRYEVMDEWGYELLSFCIYFCQNKKLRSKLEKQLQTILAGLPEDSWSQAEIKMQQFKIIEMFDPAEKANEFIAQNLHLSEFREKAIQKAIEKEDYGQALELCADGENTSKYPGPISKWKDYRYQVYGKLGDVEKQRELAFEKILESHYDLNYFFKLKDLYTEKEWPSVLDEILSGFDRKGSESEAYLKIIIEENQQERILQYCFKSPRTIGNLFAYIIDTYPDEVNSIFSDYILKYAAVTSNRNEYKKVCKEIKTYKKACGADNARSIIEDLKLKYKQRPAFLDELSKIK
ncbi:SWIM zinc finger family protein [Metabacillus idriensis]|uniref:SWIM zinc finger family protein n=1 Tax=Metabacillus idriensis TaxID=324768 RepID=UPI00174E9241|nr:hypothetical protein [Metabacillus idriensis]